MRISIVQTDILWQQPASNREKLETVLEGLAGSDLVVLPEMFSTGFIPEPEGHAEQKGESLTWMKSVAARLDFALAGSIAVEEGTDGLAPKVVVWEGSKTMSSPECDFKRSYRNRFYFVKPDGGTEFYDKKHLFTYSGEDKKYVPGCSKTIVTWRDFRIMLQVCYDLRFPKFSRNSVSSSDGRADYDLCLYVASWPQGRSDAWKALLRARAIENQCYVVGVNRVGKDPGNNYSGDSAIIGPFGETLTECPGGSECTATCEINLRSLESFRKQFPVLPDAD